MDRHAYQKSRHLVRLLKGCAYGLVGGGLMLALALAGGCATTDDSDMPWATPASWEGSPFIPGLSE